MEGLKTASAALSKEVEAAKKQLASQLNGIGTSRKRIDEIDTKVLQFKEQLAMSGAGSTGRPTTS